MSRSCPTEYTTDRLLLRQPRSADAPRIFSEYAGDPRVGRFLAWPIHKSIEDTHEFLVFSDSEWRTRRGGPYLIFTRDGSTLLGSTGLAFESDERASTGYVIAHRHWGNGIATEALRAITEIAARIQLKSLYALCHPDHVASQNVLKKNGFHLTQTVEKGCPFPNQPNPESRDVFCFEWDDGEMLNRSGPAGPR